MPILENLASAAFRAGLPIVLAAGLGLMPSSTAVDKVYFAPSRDFGVPIAFSWDGMQIYTSAGKILSASDGSPIAGKVPEPPTYQAISQDGMIGVKIKSINQLEVYQARSNVLLSTIGQPLSPESTFAESINEDFQLAGSNGDRLLARHRDQTLRGYDARTGKEVYRIKAVGFFSVSNLRNTFVAAIADPELRYNLPTVNVAARVYDAKTGAQIFELPGPHGKEHIVSYMRDESRILTYTPLSAAVWDAGTGTLIYRLDAGAAWEYDNPAFAQVTESPDGSKLATLLRDGTVKIWNAANGSLIRTLKPNKVLYQGFVGSLGSGFVFSPDGTRLMAYDRQESEDKPIKGLIWDVASGDVITEISEESAEINLISSSYGGTFFSTIITFHQHRSIQERNRRLDEQHPREWQGIDPTRRRILKAEDQGDVWYTSIGAGESMTATVNIQGKMHLWRNGKLVFGPYEGFSAVKAESFYGVRRIIHGDQVIELNTGQVSRTLDTAAMGPIHMSSFSSDGKRILTAHSDATARLWNANTGALVTTFSGHSGAVLDASISTNGKIVATASRDKTAKLFDATTGNLLHTLTGHTAKVNSIRFSFDGSQVVTASDDGTAKVWSVSNGSLVSTITGHTKEVNVALFPYRAYNIVLTASNDGKAKMWNAGTGRPN